MMNQTASLYVYCGFHLISCGFHHSLSEPGCRSPLRSHCIEPDSSSGVGQRRGGKTVLKPLHLLWLMMMLSLAWSRTVWGRFTPIIPLGAAEPHRAPKHRHSITSYMIAGRAGDNGPATMSFCITDKCLIWLTQPASVSEEWHWAHRKMDDSYTIETLCGCNNRTRLCF